MPTGRNVSVYLPAPSVTTRRTKFVFTLVAATLAPGTTAPLLSSTVPSMVPLAWAQRAVEDRQSIAQRRMQESLFKVVSRSQNVFPASVASADLITEAFHPGPFRMADVLWRRP